MPPPPTVERIIEARAGPLARMLGPAVGTLLGEVELQGREGEGEGEGGGMGEGGQEAAAEMNKKDRGDCIAMHHH